MIKTACINYNLFKFIKILYSCTLRLIATLELITKLKSMIPLFFPDNFHKESKVYASKKSLAVNRISVKHTVKVKVKSSLINST